MKTMKQIADEAERRWAEAGLTEGQKASRRAWGKFVIHPETKKNASANTVSLSRSRVDQVADELRAKRELKEVWEP